MMCLVSARRNRQEILAETLTAEANGKVSMRILIAGNKGQLGFDCFQLWRDHHALRAADLPELDITRAESVARICDEFQPEIIVNCAAFTKVDACETDKATAWAVNADGPRRLAEYAARTNARLVHISTDYVFDGARPPPQPYTEADPPNPVSYYGISKLAGEIAVRETLADHAILRTAWLYGINGNNFLRAILRQSVKKDRPALKVVNDQHGALTWSFRLAQQIDALLQQWRPGTYHATAEGHGTWYDCARCFLQLMGSDCQVLPCTTADYPLPAKRPANSILENKIFNELGINRMRDWREDLGDFVLQYKDQLWKEVRP